MNNSKETFCISGVGIFVPDRILTNEEIESWNIGTTADWIKNNIGVIDRRLASENDKCYDFAIKAAQNALQSANISSDEIDLIITSSVTSDNIMPHTAAFVKSGLKAHKAICFDILAACAGFAYGMIVAINMAKSDPNIRNILVVASELFSKITDWTDKKLCCAYGDGAGAFVIKKSEGEEGILATTFIHDDEGVKYHDMPAFYGNVPNGAAIYHRYSGRHVLELLKKNIPQAIEDLLKKTCWSKDELNLVIMSQANKNMIQDILLDIGISYEKTHTIMHKYGYTASSCLPIATFDAMQSGILKKGDKIIIVGAGLGCYFAGISLVWAI